MKGLKQMIAPTLLFLAGYLFHLFLTYSYSMRLSILEGSLPLRVFLFLFLMLIFFLALLGCIWLFERREPLVALRKG